MSIHLLRLAFISLFFAIGQGALGDEITGKPGYAPKVPKNSVPSLHHGLRNVSRLQKFSVALQTLGIPPEAKPDFAELPSHTALTQTDFETQLSYIDPHLGLRRYFDITSTAVSTFQNFFSLSGGILPEYRFNFSRHSAPSDSEGLINHLNQISGQVKSNIAEPLQGLKIVLDPGHMGTDFWDEATGKYVKLEDKKVSEGDLNLWTAYLVANELEDLGAMVTITRTEAGPVTKSNLQNFNATPFINQYFYDSLDNWMEKYLALDEAEIKETIKEKPEVKKAYTSDQQEQFFIEGEDLEAREKIIEALQPDITLDIHYDAEDSTKLQDSNDAMETFVPGGLLETESGSRLMRAYAMNQLLSVRRFNESVNLASELVHAMSLSEGVSLESVNGYYNAEMIKGKDGVYARNLYISARNITSLMIYVECLHYDHVKEFNQLTELTESGIYRGIHFQYPKRINAVAQGVKNGLLNYFKR